MQYTPLPAMMVVGKLISQPQQKGKGGTPSSQGLRSPWLNFVGTLNAIWKLWSLPHLLVRFPFFSFFPLTLYYIWNGVFNPLDLISWLQWKWKMQVNTILEIWLFNESQNSLLICHKEEKGSKVKVVYKTIKLSSLRSNYLGGISSILHSIVIWILKGI